MLQAAYRQAALEDDKEAAEAILLDSPTNNEERQRLGALHPSVMAEAAYADDCKFVREDVYCY
mgnify:CR=1 FL=1